MRSSFMIISGTAEEFCAVTTEDESVAVGALAAHWLIQAALKTSAWAQYQVRCVALGHPVNFP